MQVKEPFLLSMSLFFIVLPLLPIPFHRKGKPLENDRLARIACIAIGIASLFLWYSLPPK